MRITWLLLAVALPAAAQTTNSAIDAQSVIQRASAAMGCSIINPATNVRITAHLQVPSIPGPMGLIIDSQGNSRWRSELDTPKEHKVTIVNDGKGQMQHADGRVIALSDDNSAHQRPMHIPCLTDLALPPGRIDTNYLRTEVAAADALDVIEVLPVTRPSQKAAAARFRTVFWISRATGYVTKLQYVNAAEQDANDTQTVEIDYDDYRVTQGLAVPFHQITHSGNFSLDLQIESVQLDSPAADFQLR